MKKVISVVGARPNYMKVAPVHRAFERYRDSIEHLIVHTGQHYSQSMSDAFFEDLKMPEPAEFLDVGSASHAEQTARIMVRFEKVCLERKPDLVLVAGDVNSTIACALTATKCGIRAGHIEGGLRSFDRTMPEEINRIATDAICDYCFVTEQSGLDNLKKEGFPAERAFFVGNTMIDSLHFAMPAARSCGILPKMGLCPHEYALVTLHRPSNVDEPGQLRRILEILAELSRRRIVVVPLHPRTRKNVDLFGLQSVIESAPGLRVIDPLGYIHFLGLVLEADFVLTDSGGIQEETTALGIPCITMRTTTERPVTCEIGTNILVHPEAEKLRQAIADMMDKPRKVGRVPPLWDGRAAERIAEILARLLK
ncbi:MAG TPA: UDP-N-acetylglucosamine 2-epimerase (non-hydrolyzing) [Acidobacteriota bacterium]|nr:UDP-N-acetylglucosamine 2-epimerase (non-hydrolyzing) [Acidobacteriota bacterium]